MISKFLATQPNILKQKINQTYYSASWRSKEETEKSKTLQPMSFVKERVPLSWGLQLFPIQLIGISQKSKCYKIKDSNIWDPKHNPVESTNMMQSQLVDGKFKSLYF